MIAHIAGMPLEEALVPLLSGVGSGLVLARAWAAGTIGRNRRRRRDGVPQGRDS